MASALDVARYITDKLGEMSAMKLQKLVYYAQAWHMVWFERELFPEDFQAWANGPVATSLYHHHRKQFLVSSNTFAYGNVGNLSPEQRDAIDRVLGFYGGQTAQWLSNLTHQEAPWREARGQLADGERCENVIEKGSMHAYYSAL